MQNLGKMENKGHKEISKKELEKRIRLVKQAIIELRENPNYMKKVEKLLVC
jgi:hypothetical protein